MADRAWAATVVVIDAPTDGTDATDIIREQIAAASDGAPGDPTIIRFPVGRSTGRYRVDGQVVISSRQHLVIEGPSAADPALIWTDRTGKDMGIVDQHGNSKRAHWVITGGSSDILLKNVAAIGPNGGRSEGAAEFVTGLVFEHGFLVTGGAQGVRIDHCSAENVHGDGAYVAGRSSNVRLSSTKLAFCGRQGISITDADNVLIDGCNLSGVRNSGIDLEPNGAGWFVSNIEIRNCSIDCRHVAFTAAGHSDVSDVWIHHNVVQHSSTSWPMLNVVRSEGGRANNWTFEDNVRVGTTNPFFMVSLTRVDNIAIRRNTAVTGKGTKTIAAVELNDCAGTIDIAGNDFSWSPELFLQTTSTPAVTHQGNKWGANGSLTEGQSPGVPEPETPPTTAQIEESTVSSGASSATPETPETSTTETSPEAISGFPKASEETSTTTRPINAAVTPKPATSTSNTAVHPSTHSTDTPSMSGAAEDDGTEGLLVAVQSLVTPTRLVTTGVLAGLGSLIGFVIKRGPRDEDRRSQVNQTGSPIPATAERFVPDSSQDQVPSINTRRPSTVDGVKYLPSAQMASNSAHSASRNRVERDAWRFASEYQGMNDDRFGGANDAGHRESVNDPSPEQ